MDKCTCKITPGTSAYGGNQIDSRGCEKHDTRDEIIEQLRQERDNALRYTELLIAERDTAQAGEARAVETLRAVVAGAYPLDNQPSALDWLDQQRRKAAAEALEEFAYDADGIEELITCNIFDLRSALRTRAAALRAGEAI